METNNPNKKLNRSLFIDEAVGYTANIKNYDYNTESHFDKLEAALKSAKEKGVTVTIIQELEQQLTELKGRDERARRIRKKLTEDLNDLHRFGFETPLVIVQKELEMNYDYDSVEPQLDFSRTLISRDSFLEWLKLGHHKIKPTTVTAILDAASEGDNLPEIMEEELPKESHLVFFSLFIDMLYELSQSESKKSAWDSNGSPNIDAMVKSIINESAKKYGPKAANITGLSKSSLKRYVEAGKDILEKASK